MLRSVGLLSFVSLTAFCASVAHAQEEAAAPLPGRSNEDAPHELDAIVVQGKLVESPSAPPSTTTTVTKEELEKFEDDDVHQVLLRVPGVQIRGEDGVGLRPNIGIRGTSPNRSAKIALLEDGVLLGPAPYAAPAAYFFPMVTRMTEVQVHKGGAQLRTGPRALGGAINLVTADIPDGFGLNLDTAVGEYGYFKEHARGGYGTERIGFLLEALHVRSTGFKELDGGGNTGFDKNEVMAKWRVNSSPAAEVYHQFDLKLGVATERSDETYLGLTDSDFRADPNRRYVASELDEMKWQRGQVQATYTVFPTEDLEVRATAYRHQFTRDWFKLDSFGGAELDDVLGNPNSPSNRIYYDVLTGQSDSTAEEEYLQMAGNYRWYVSQGVQADAFGSLTTGDWEHEWELGARFHYDEVNRRHTGSSYQMAGAEDGLARPEDTGLPRQPLARNRGSAHALSAHFVDTITWKQLTLTPGIRVEAVWTAFRDHLDPSGDNERTQVGVMPGAGAHYQLTDRIGFLGGIYRGFGPVAPQSAAAGEPKPETSTTYELGTRYSTPSSHLETVGFYNHYGNLTANCSQAQGCTPEDVGQQFDGGKVDAWGIEALIGHQFTMGDLTLPLRATYTWTQSAFREPFDSTNPEWGRIEQGDELPYLPGHQATIGGGLAKERKWSVDLTSTFVSSARETAGQGEISEDERTDATAILGAAGKYRIISDLWIYLRGSNLLSSSYLVSRRPHGARPTAPRWIHLGLKFDH